MTMDFGRNRWSASLSGVPLLTEQPMTTNGAALTLGNIGAFLVLNSPTLPAADYMVYDNYLVSASPNATPKLLMGPQSQTVNAGGTVSLAVVASGSSPLSYRWYYNNVLIPNATNASLVLA